MKRIIKLNYFVVIFLLGFLVGVVEQRTQKRYFYNAGISPLGRNDPCPGYYCGRNPINKTFMSGCMSCVRGTRVENKINLERTLWSHSYCLPCQDPANFRDWYFLACLVIFVVVLEWISIDYIMKSLTFTRSLLIMHFSAVIEIGLASIITLLINDPLGSVNINMCKLYHVADWYPLFYHPNPNYEGWVYCTSEVVYPRFTIIFEFHTLCILFLFIIRLPVVMIFNVKKGTKTIFGPLFLMPALAVFHSLVGGMLYFYYEYLVLILSLISSAYHFACKLDQSMKYLFIECFNSIRPFIILMGHWMLHAFGILPIASVETPSLRLLLLICIPIPSLFYILTARFTNSGNFKAMKQL